MTPDEARALAAQLARVANALDPAPAVDEAAVVADAAFEARGPQTAVEVLRKATGR